MISDIFKRSIYILLCSDELSIAIHMLLYVISYYVYLGNCNELYS